MFQPVVQPAPEFPFGSGETAMYDGIKKESLADDQASFSTYAQSQGGLFCSSASSLVAPPSVCSDDIPLGQPDPPLTTQELMASIETGTTKDAFAARLGFPLTEGNLGKYQKIMSQQAAARRPEADTRELTEAEQKRVKNLQDAINGTWDARSYLGNQFRAEHKAGTPLGDEFKKLTSRAEQAEFRRRWCEHKLKETLTKKTFSSSWSRIDKTKGRYRTLGRLILDFGGYGSAEAIQGAMTAASKCCLLGEPWCVVHPQSGLSEYLVMEIEWEEQFSRCWTDYQEFFNKSANQAEQFLQAVQSDVRDRAEQGKDKHKSKGKNKDGEGEEKRRPETNKRGADASPQPKGKKGKHGQDAKDDSPDDKKKKELTRLIKDAAKLKATFHEASSNYAHIISNIDGNDSWSWAKSSPQNKMLQQAHAEVKGLLNEWHREFLSHADIKPMRAKYPAEKVTVELRAFLAAGAKVESLGKLISGMNAAHEAVLQITA